MVSVVITTVSTLWAAYQIGYFDGKGVCGYPGFDIYQSYEDVARMKIALALIVSSIAFSFRRLLTSALSLLGLIVAAAIYGSWYWHSLRLLRYAHLSSFSQTSIPHSGGLLGATNFDLAILAVTLILFLWQVRIFLKAINQTTSSNSRR